MKSLNTTHIPHITRKQFYSSMLSIRNGKFCPILRGGKLLQQYMVEDFVKVENDRMNYFRKHQSLFKSEQYETVMDNMDENGLELEMGRHIILPSSHIGSPHNMYLSYAHAMAIITQVCKGKADLFLTMTCNPNWEEITQNLYEGQTSGDRFVLIKI